MRCWLWSNLVICALAGGVAGVCFSFGLYLTAATMVLLCVLTAFMPLWFKRGFRYGWLAGRQAMLNSMAEATRRRMSFPDWLQAEMERDGIPCVQIEVEVETDE